jgi:HEAT repeat protein
MLDWLKRITGNSRPASGVAGMNEQSWKLLAEDIETLDQLSPDISQRILNYLADGQAPQVLTEVSVLPKVAEKFHLRLAGVYITGVGVKNRRDFFASLRCESPEFFQRLGRVYLACCGQARQAFPDSFEDQRLRWLEVLLVEAFGLSLNVWPRKSNTCPALGAEMVERLIELEGLPGELLVRTAFQPAIQRFYGATLEPVFLNMEGLAQAALRHRATVVSALAHYDFKQRVYALEMIAKCKTPPAEFKECLVELAVSSSKQVREAAQHLLAQIKSEVRPLLEHKLVEGSNEEKPLAVALLWSLIGEDSRPFLTERLGVEKGKKTVRAIQEALELPEKSPEVKEEKIEASLDFSSLDLSLDRETEHAWLECFKEFNSAVSKFNASQAGRPHAHALELVPPGDVRKGFEQLQAGATPVCMFRKLPYLWWRKELAGAFLEFWRRPELNLVHLIRFLMSVGGLKSDADHHSTVLSYGHWLETLFPACRSAHPELGLRELGAAFRACGLDPKRIGSTLLQSFQPTRSPLGLPPEGIWPYWAENLDLLEQAFGAVSGDYMERFRYRHSRRNALFAIATFPSPPARLTPLLWKLALGPKSERPDAQRCLESAPDKFERVIAALKGGEAESRLSAAEWLGRIKDTRAIEPVLAALKRETNEMAKGVMMSALELLGASIDQFLDRETLSSEAEKGVSKGVPEKLKWFPFASLPTLHWADGHKEVDPKIIQWWVINGFKLKNPEPGPLLRRYCASLAVSEREAVGQFVLEAWIGHDTVPIPRSEAEQKANQFAQQMSHWCQSPHWPKNSPKKSFDEYYASVLPTYLVQPKDSAIDCKGVLALAAACAGGQAAPVVGQYLKHWYGMRAAQCRALLQMLAWVEHKAATQLLLSVGSRFRTKGIQEEANSLAKGLADRKGWTVAELADRTIPSAGMDDEGVLTLDFGTRQFTAKLNEDLEFELTDSEGKSLKSLPDARKDDDEAKAAEAKKIFAAAKKELKSVVSMQRDRFYEAMCTQRSWPAEDWNVYLNRHPIARHHCQRLVWAIFRDDKIVALFRPLPDGSLTDSADDPISLATEDQVRIAHEQMVLPEQSLAWRQHLKDYEVEPLFEQFGRASFSLPEERAQQDELDDFKGHMLEAFKLRGRATKLGYTRGQAQDGGWFYEYHKRFPTLGMAATLEFTGNGLPEENRNVALTVLKFERSAPEGEPNIGGARMLLGEVPAVLISECWNDLRQIAAEGPGFDPDWEKEAQT